MNKLRYLVGYNMQVMLMGTWHSVDNKTAGSLGSLSRDAITRTTGKPSLKLAAARVWRAIK